MKKYTLYKGGSKNIFDDFKKKYKLYCKNYNYTPAILPAVPRIIVIGDIHGDFDLTIKLLTIANVIKIINDNVKWIGGSTYVVQIGDQIDSYRPDAEQKSYNHKNTTLNDQPNDIKIMKLFTLLDKKARKHGGMVISLLGNHELMNVEGDFSYVSYENMKEFENYKDPITKQKFNNVYEARRHAFLPGNEYGKFLGCTRLPAVIIGSNLFVHAGIIDKLINQLKINNVNDLEKINECVRKWLIGLIKNNTYNDEIISRSKTSMFWSRILGSIPPNINLENNICSSNIGKVLKLFKINKIIIGHTPQPFLHHEGINSTCSNTVWRSDNGSSNAFSKFDIEFLKTGISSNARQPQVIEILNDNHFKIIK